MKHLRIFDLLPKTDCQKCGHDTCFVFATELAQRQTSLEACPDVSGDARRMLMELVDTEREMVSSLWGLISGVSKTDVMSALRLFREVFIMFPVRVISFLLFTVPFSFPIILVVIWLFMR